MGAVESTTDDNSDNSTTYDNSYKRTRQVQNLKPHKPEEWEIHLVGDLLLNILSSNHVAKDKNWLAKKSDLRREFIKITTAEIRQNIKELNGTDNIGTILYRCGFLCHTPRGSPFYELKCENYIQYIMNRNRKRNNKQNEASSISKSEDRPQLKELQKAMHKIDINDKRNKNNKVPRKRKVQSLKDTNCNKQPISNNIEKSNKVGIDKKYEHNEPTTSKAGMKLNLNANSEEDSTKINNKSNLDMIFADLPRVPNINLVTTKKSEIPIAQIRPMQHAEENQKECNENRNTNENLSSSSKYSNSDGEAAIKVQQYYEDKEYNTKLQQELVEDKECAKELQQQLEELNKNSNMKNTEILSPSQKYSNSEGEAAIKVQQHHSDEEYRKKLQQELKDEEYAKKLQQQYKDEMLENQKAQPNQPIITEISNTIAISTAPQTQQTQDEIFKNRITQLDNEKLQYSNYMQQIRNEHDQEQIQYNKYKFNWNIPHNKEYEIYWRQHCTMYDQREKDFEKFKRENHFKREHVLDQYHEYMRQKRRAEGKGDECSIQ